MNGIEEILNQHEAERSELAGQLLQALRDKLPWGLMVDLGLGRSAELIPLNGSPDASKPYRQPIYPDGTPPAVDPNNPIEPVGYAEWKFSFDWRLTNCDQDHIEVTVHVTGGGGSVQ